VVRVSVGKGGISLSPCEIARVQFGKAAADTSGGFRITIRLLIPFRCVPVS